MTPAPPLRIEWLGTDQDYRAVHARMAQQLEDRIHDRVPDTLLLCEHPPVFTLGRRRGAEANVLLAGEVPVVPVERGGDVTFHGPGQLVGYPVCRLPPHRQDLHAWLRGLEDMLIGAMARFGVHGVRDPRNTGVWIDGRKAAAIGVACRRWVTWHGFALNVHTDLAYFDRINPCGLGAGTVTRLADHTPSRPGAAQVRAAVSAEFRAFWHELHQTASTSD